MVKEDIILSYSGQLQYDTIGHLINRMNEKMEPLKPGLPVYKKILSLMVEMLENIYRYNEHFENEPHIMKDHPPEFILACNDERYYIQTGNAVLKTDARGIMEKIDTVNELDKSELKQLYKNTITNGQFSQKGGAGLGFIEMAKLSGSKLEYSFKDINRNYFFYRLKIYIYNNNCKRV
ncbi:MAG: SiaB family protein kinase [Bacteroidota bacterium]